MRGVRQAAAVAITMSKLLPRYDLYTGLYLPKRLASREHVVQKSVLLKAGLKHAVWDIDNLYCVDTAINSMRSNYKFVDGDAMEMYDNMGSIESRMMRASKRVPCVETEDDMTSAVTCIHTSGKIVKVSVCYGGTVMVVDKSKKTVAPPLIARGAIARTVYKMYERYNGLYDFRHLVLEEDVMERWLKLPKHSAEINTISLSRPSKNVDLV
jgi:hypothetical protein